MKYHRQQWIGALAGALLAVGPGLHAAEPGSLPGTSSYAGIDRKFVSLTATANAVIAEPVRTDPVRGRIALLVAHPEHLNMFDYFVGREMAQRGYRTMMMNYYGREESYDEFLAPLAAAVRYLKSLPGVERVVLAAHSTGGAELSFYQDVAENGPKACQGAERVYKCRGSGLDSLPKADGIMLLDINIGGPLRTLSIDPAVDNSRPRGRNPELDMFATANGYDTASRTGRYSPEFQRKYYAAQQKRNQQLLDAAQSRLAAIDRGEGLFADDENFLVAGGSTRMNGARLDLADTRLGRRTRAPHVLLKADGTSSTQVIVSPLGGLASAADLGRLNDTAQNGTVRHFLSFYGLRTTPDLAVTEDSIRGIVWRSSANSAPGNMEGVTVPTLVVASACYMHLVASEISFDHAAARDKEFVAIEGADHFFRACKPQYGDPAARAFSYVDSWLTKPGRF